MEKSGTKNFASPGLSLTLAGAFTNTDATEEVEEVEESGGREETVEISGENTAPLEGSDEDWDAQNEDNENIGDNSKKRKKRLKYHRHTAQQIREMEALFKESPHPDEKQRQQLSEQLGLSPRQIKFWFQNRRTQIKTIQERHENSLLKSEVEKLREENLSMREAIKKKCCPYCGVANVCKDVAITSEEQQLRIENARLKAENQWKEMFPCMISKASVVDVISEGEGDTRTGLVQLIFCELQMLTPMVTSRESYFVRHCKKLSHDQWAILDVSVDKIKENIGADLMKFRKRPSGCIIEDRGNGHCKVVWVEHVECHKNVIPTMYRSIVNNGQAFGARHWMATLQLQCERMMFLLATNVPTKDSIGVPTLAGRRSVLQLAQRMCSSFCHATSASRNRIWTKASTTFGDDIRFATRKNINDPGEPHGLIMCVVSSTWLAVPSAVLFDFLRDESRRTEWDYLLSRGPAETIVNLVKGKDRRNSVTVHAMKSTERNGTWVLQDSCTNDYESMIIYAPVDANGIQSVMTGCDSSNIVILPSGFSILPDGIDSMPTVITSRPKEKSHEGGSLLTIAFQSLTNASSSAEAVENGKSLILCTTQNIKRSLNCDDG